MIRVVAMIFIAVLLSGCFSDKASYSEVGRYEIKMNNRGSAILLDSSTGRTWNWVAIVDDNGKNEMGWFETKKIYRLTNFNATKEDKGFEDLIE